ncbi:MAG: ABC transporter substrate-binding protein [Gemmobacter sp.]|uniref:ABC transporter substrate-binding protein n=1 Tax=Gemmobacter sp. TaxID=1898957 RepID=UPI001A38EEC0|nr:ABC transporter substrate-binding protein [Gemmobacter sp.]MBL8563326.1 ABC transporter substrate-binding protein [Gemmobacter sp.]
MTREIALGYVPLVDAAPLLLADALGFAEEQGLHLTLHRAANWSMLRDMLDQGQVMAAQMLSAMPVARALGLGSGRVALETPLILSQGGQVVGASAPLAEALARQGQPCDFTDAASTARAIAALHQPLRIPPLRIGVPFAHSMHALLVEDWLAGMPATFLTVAPPLMPEALAEGALDLFCVGEPWGSQAVVKAGARLLLPGAAIRHGLPEKVLACRAGWCEAEADLAGRLVRALSGAGDWLARPGNASTAAEVLTRPGRVDVAAELIERALTGRIVTDPVGTEHLVPGFQDFGPARAMRPMAVQAQWIASRLALRHGRGSDAESLAAAVFRGDLHDRFLSLTTA